MEAQTLKQIVGLARDADGKTVEIDGKVFSTQELHDPDSAIKPKEAFKPLAVWTLQALVDYLKCAIDSPVGVSEGEGNVVVHVETPWSVRVLAGLDSTQRRRENFLAASCLGVVVGKESRGFQFGQFMEPAEFVIALQTLFVDTPDRAALLSIVGNIQDTSELQAQDDGVSQKVTVRQSVTRVGAAEIKNPWKLQPYRTFREVDQVAAPFVLRMRKDDGPEVALFEIDGGQWQLEAIDRVATWLRWKLPTTQVIA